MTHLLIDTASGRQSTAVSTALLITVTGLALLDSLNPATILGVGLILVLPNRHPVRAALAYVLGAYLTVLASVPGSTSPPTRRSRWSTVG